MEEGEGTLLRTFTLFPRFAALEANIILTRLVRVPMAMLSTRLQNSPNWPENDKRFIRNKDNWGGYDENFLPAAVKHRIAVEKMNLDYYARDQSGASHYFRPLRYHGDGVVPQWGPNGGVPPNPLPEVKGGETKSGGSPGYKLGKEVEKDVEGWRSRR